MRFSLDCSIDAAGSDWSAASCVFRKYKVQQLQLDWRNVITPELSHVLMLPNTVTVLLSPLMTWNYLKYVTVSKSLLRWAFLSTALSRLRLLCTLLCGVQTGSSCTIVHSYVVFLSDYWYFCPHVCPHGVHGQSNPGIVDYSDAFPIIKFRNFVFVGILTSRQLDWSTANKWTQIAQWNSAHLELLMGVRWVYVLTLEPHNIWICCNSWAISPGLQNGLYSAVQWVRSLYTCTELQGRCCSQARTRADFWTDDWWSTGVRI